MESCIFFWMRLFLRISFLFSKLTEHISTTKRGFFVYLLINPPVMELHFSRLIKRILLIRAFRRRSDLTSVQLPLKVTTIMITTIVIILGPIPSLILLINWLFLKETIIVEVIIQTGETQEINLQAQAPALFQVQIHLLAW